MHVARKRFGQNFLTDRSVVARIVDAIAPQPDDPLLEIGPGLGALTGALLERVEHLHAIEIDRDLVAHLAHAFPSEKLTIHQGDALTFDFSRLGPGMRVVGNLPYNISTPLLFHFAAQAGCIRDVHVMLQHEVVTRMTAAPGTTDYGRLSVMLQYRFGIERIMTVPPEAFRPAPKVESAVARLIPFATKPHTARDETLFGQVVTAAFSQRRKMLRNTLRNYLAADDFDALAVAPTARAETLSVGDFVRIADHVAMYKRNRQDAKSAK
jgi:16S rRNA (adenine1518-N6/adenine1519-N6)-dimethyltransferase